MIRTIDVTVPLSPEVPTFPGDPRFQLEVTHSMAKGEPYNVTRIVMGSHSGTHVDAPFHFEADGATVDHLPLDALIGAARVVELAGRDRIDVADLASAGLDGVERVLFKTRMSGQLRHPDFREDFVYITPEAAAALVAKGVKLVGIDYLSVEKFGSQDFDAHHALLRAGVVVVEGLDLSGAEPGDYDVICLPLLVAGADGAPARVVLRTRG